CNQRLILQNGSTFRMLKPNSRPRDARPAARIALAPPGEPHEREKFRRLAAGRGKSRESAAQFADRRLRLSRRALRILELARRAARLAGNRGSLRPVSPHSECVCRWSRRVADALRPGDQQLRKVPRESRQAIFALQL